MSRKKRNKSSPQKNATTTNNQAQNNKQIIHQQTVYSGPIPSPDVIERYDQIVPGAADRIVAMAEAEAHHRRGIEERNAEINHQAMSKTFAQQKLGQVLAFIITIIAIAMAGYCATIGMQWAAVAIAVSSAVPIVTAFLKGKKN